MTTSTDIDTIYDEKISGKVSSMNSLRYLKFEIKAPTIPSRRNPEGNMLRCAAAAAAAALSFLSTSDSQESEVIPCTGISQEVSSREFLQCFSL